MDCLIFQGRGPSPILIPALATKYQLNFLNLFLISKIPSYFPRLTLLNRGLVFSSKIWYYYFKHTPTPSHSNHSHSLKPTTTHSHPLRAILIHPCLYYYKCHECISTYLHAFKHSCNKEIMHEMSHVVNKLNGFSDSASFGTFYGLLIQS